MLRADTCLLLFYMFIKIVIADIVHTSGFSDIIFLAELLYREMEQVV